MAYLSLYRKYRSQSFEDVSGQEHVTRTLQNALKAGRVGHAYLFSGPRGTGKTSTARLLARALNCERGPTPQPCGECVECQEIRDGISPSVVEIDAASSRGIDEVRELRQRVMTVPSRSGARKVFIVDEVHMLTTEACNALLKTLEEPPSHVLFILATTDAQKLPATILSRCQRFEFRRGSVGLIGERLKFVAEAEQYALEPEALRLVARASGGSWRDAISLLEQVLSYGGSEVTAAQVAAVLGTVGEEALLDLADGLSGAEGRAVYSLVDSLISDGTEPRQLAHDLGEHFRSLLLADAGALPADATSADTAARLTVQAARFGTSRLVTALEALAQAEKEMRWSDSGRVVLEVALARLMLSGAPMDVPATTAVRQAAAGNRQTGDGHRAHRTASAPGRVADAPSGTVPMPAAVEQPQAATPPSDSRPLATEVDRNATLSQSPETVSEEPFDPFEHEDLPHSVVGNRAVNASDPSIVNALPSSLHPIRERWNVVIEELKRMRSVTTAGLLEAAQPLRCDEGVLVVGFRYAVHRDLWERGDHKQRLAAALQSVLGQSLRVRGEVMTEGTTAEAEDVRVKAPAAPSAQPPSAAVVPETRAAAPANGSPAAPDVLEGEPLLHHVIAVFDGKIMEQETH